MVAVPFDTGEVVRRLTTRLKMRHLVLLLQIQQHGSLTRVAEHMATSQPAVTSALAELESMLGGPLFDRTPRGMTPTPLGDVVLARAQAMVHDLDHLTRDIEAVMAGHAARLQVGVIPYISGKTLSAAIQQTVAQIPQRLTVTLHEGTSESLMAQLRDHTLDVVIARAAANVDVTQVQFEVLHHQAPRVVASRRLAARLGRGAPVWAQLAELDWVMGAPNTPMRDQLSDLFLHAGVVPPVPVVESFSSRLTGELLASSERAVSLLPADIAEELVRIAGVAIVPWSLTWTLPPVAMFTRRENPRETHRLFTQALRAQYQLVAGTS